MVPSWSDMFRRSGFHDVAAAPRTPGAYFRRFAGGTQDGEPHVVIIRSGHPANQGKTLWTSANLNQSLLVI
ncbi:hypothetical protein GCM10027294_07420 [Marinactinospora endophytica]